MQDTELSINDNGLGLDDTTALAAILIAIVAVVAVYVVRRIRTRGRAGLKQSSDRLLWGFVAALLFTFVLLCPVLFAIQDGNGLTLIPLVPVRLLQAVSIDNGFVDFIEDVPTSVIANIYYVLLGAMYVVLPVLTALNIFDLFRQRMADLNVRCVVKHKVKGKNVFLFSDLNENTLGLAKDALEADGNSFIIFSAMSKTERDTWSTEINELGDICASYLEVDYPGLAVRLCDSFKFATLRCFAVSPDSAKNVSETCTMISCLRARPSSGRRASKAFIGYDGEWRGADEEIARRVEALHIFVLYDSADDELVIDAANREDVGKRYGTPKLKVTTMREATMAAYALFDEAPLFTVLGEQESGEDGLRPAGIEKLNVLVVGSGEVAEEAMKVALWCGQMHNVSLDVLVADDHADEIRSRVALRYPALCEPASADGKSMRDSEGLFALEFEQMRVQSSELEDLCVERYISRGSDHLYVIVALDDDALSHEIAMHIRLLFLDKARGRFNGEVRTRPFIACQIRDKAMAALINSQFDESVPEYGICPFGCSRELFSYGNIIDSPLERVGQVVDEVYGILSDSNGGIGKKAKGAFRGEEINSKLLKEVVNDIIGSEDAQLRLIGASSKPNTIATKSQIIHYSNLAAAMHIRYKAWALGLHGSRATTTEDIRAEALKPLGDNEHNRWVVYYQTQGYTRLDQAGYKHYSQLLKGDNRRRKIEPLKKHSLICPNDEIWLSYVSVQSGFEYERKSTISPGSRGAAVALIRTEDVAVQLLDAEYRVVREWPKGGKTVCEVQGLPAGTYRAHPAGAVDGRSCAEDVEFRIDQGDLESGTPKIVKVDCSGDKLVNPVVYDWAFAFATPYLRGLLDCKNIKARQLFHDGGGAFRKKPGLTGFQLICTSDYTYDAYNMFEDAIYKGGGYYVRGLEGEEWKVWTLADVAGSYVFDGSAAHGSYAQDGAALDADLISAAREVQSDASELVVIPIRYKDSNGAPIMALRAPGDIKFVDREHPDSNATSFKVNGELNRFGKRIKHGRAGDMLACPLIRIEENSGQEDTQRNHPPGCPVWEIDGQVYYADLSEMYVINGRIFARTYSEIASARRR